MTNARKEWTYHKRLSLGKEGKIVAPVFAKTYWYNNQTDADSIRAQHVAHVQTLLDDDYMAAVQEIAGYPSVIDAQDFAAARATTAMLPQKRCAITASSGAFSRTSDRSQENLKCSARAL